MIEYNRVRLEVPVDLSLLDPNGGLPSSYQAFTRSLSSRTQLNRLGLGINIVLGPYLMGAGVVYRRPKMVYKENKTKAPDTN